MNANNAIRLPAKSELGEPGVELGRNSKVYFAQIGFDGPIKIGTTRGRITRRLAELQIGCPWKITLLGYIAGTRDNEISLHDHFVQHRLQGEWFSPASDLLEAILTIFESGWEWRPTKPQSEVAALIDAFGGSAAFGRIIGRGQSTASEMKRRGKIPNWYWLAVIEAAEKSGIDGVSSESLMWMNIKATREKGIVDRRRRNPLPDCEVAA